MNFDTKKKDSFFIHGEHEGINKSKRSEGVVHHLQDGGSKKYLKTLEGESREHNFHHLHTRTSGFGILETGINDKQEMIIAMGNEKNLEKNQPSNGSKRLNLQRSLTLKKSQSVQMTNNLDPKHSAFGLKFKDKIKENSILKELKRSESETVNQILSFTTMDQQKEQICHLEKLESDLRKEGSIRNKEEIRLVEREKEEQMTYLHKSEQEERSILSMIKKSKESALIAKDRHKEEGNPVMSVIKKLIQESEEEEDLSENPNEDSNDDF